MLLSMVITTDTGEEFTISGAVPDGSQLSKFLFKSGNRRVFSTPLYGHNETPVHTICTAQGTVEETTP